MIRFRTWNVLMWHHNAVHIFFCFGTIKPTLILNKLKMTITDEPLLNETIQSSPEVILPYCDSRVCASLVSKCRF